jgi:hypothetical protein
MGYQAVFRGRAWAWLVTGLLVGIGILAKYNMALLPVSLGLFLLFTPAYRLQLGRPGFWVMSVVAALFCLPIVIWNWQHDWVTIRHVQGLAGLNDGPRWKWNGPLVYLAAQCGLYLVFWFVAWVTAMFVHRPWNEADDGLRYLWWFSAPMFAVFLIFSVKTGGGEPNWPVTAFISGLVLATGWIDQQLRFGMAWARRLIWVGLTAAIVLGVFANVFMHYSDLLYPMLTKVAAAPSEMRPLPLRRFDPTCRLRGWRTLAAEIDQLCSRLRAEGREPVIVGTGWALPGELGFYCQGHPTVYSIGPAMGDRRSQYDFWRPNPIEDPHEFLGRTLIIVGADNPSALTSAFERLDEPITVTHFERAQPIASWTIIVAHSFRGFPPAVGAKSY